MERTRTRIRLCGSLEIELDGERVEGRLHGAQGRLLLAYLVLHRERPVRRDELEAMLWGDGRPRSREALAPPLSRLRRVLGARRLIGRGELRLELGEDAWVDVEVAAARLAAARAALEAGDARRALDAAAEAVAIAAGRLLPGLEASWLDVHRGRTEELHLEALELAAAAGARLGPVELPAAERAARTAVELAPFRESARIALLEVLQARGNVAEALRAFEEARTLLRDELGATPGPALLSAHAELLRLERAPVAAAAAAPRALDGDHRHAPIGALGGMDGPARIDKPRAPTPVAGRAAAEEGLIERGRELDELGSQIERAAAGDGRLVVVEGPAGIGKSRLVAAARRRAERSMRVLSARGSELEGEFAFGVVRQLFEAELAVPARRKVLLAGAATPAAAVFGELGAGVDDADGASFAALHGLYWLVLNLAEESPLLLAVDDLHWCDRPSLLFLAYLARRLESQPVLLLLGLRDAEPGTDAALLGEIAHDPAVTSIRPRPLSEAAVAAFVEERLGAAPEEVFTAACADTTGGNPLLLSQLVTALRGDGVRPDAAHVARVTAIGPRAVSRTVLLRLARLPADARSVARAVAVLGDGAGLPVVAELAGVDERRVADATRGLAQAEILRPEPPLAFVHPLVRDAVYHGLSAGERELQHARAAVLLRDGGAPVERVAAQLLHTSPRCEPWAAELLWQAGRAAMHAGAADSAVAYLRRALEDCTADGDLGRLLFELGAAEALTSGAAAAEHLARAYEELRDPAARAAAAALLGRTQMFMGSFEDAASIARRAAQELPDELEDLRMALEAFEYMTVFFGARGPERLSGLRRYRRRPEGGPGSLMLAAMASWEAVCTDGTAQECAELALAAVADGRLRAADPELIPFAAMVALVVTDRPEAVEIWRQALADAHRRGSLLAASSIHLWHGFSHLRRGDLVAAEESLRVADDEFAMWGHDSYASVNSRAFMAEVLLERGRPDQGFRWLERIAAVPPATHAMGVWLGARAALLTAAGRAGDAVAVADELAAHCAAMPDPARLWWRSLKAEALDRLERRAEAIELAREELAVTRAFGAPWSLGRTLRVLGTLEGDEGLDGLREAVAVLEGSTARLEHAKALAALGSALRRARKPTEARGPLRRALELAGVCGAERLSEHVRSELHAAGSRPRRDALSGVESLTPSERRVADLAATGRTNRDIAQELYVTPKTVEVHLSNAYRKLGIGSRHELERALAAAPSGTP